MTDSLRKRRGTFHLYSTSRGEGVKIWPYTISECTLGGLWIDHESGDGMQVDGEDLKELVKLMDEFYKRTF